MAGGAGNDNYGVIGLDVVTELAGEGIDAVYTTNGNYTLGANLENLVYVGSGAFTGTGNELANTITGGAGNDTLNSMAGDDILNGGAGNDVLNGGAGSETMAGGAGNDNYGVIGLDVVTELAGEGIDAVYTTNGNYTLGGNLENLVYVGSGAFTGTGNELANTITGGAGNDTLNGMASNDVLNGGNGNDTLNGGAGNDTLNGGAGSETMAGGAGNDNYGVIGLDVVTELAGEGIDTVYTTNGSYTLGANLENLAYVGSGAFTGTGNGLANTITGGAGNDTLNGGAGNDTFVFAGGFGNDTIQGFDFDPAGGQDLLNVAALGVTAANFAANAVVTDIGADTRVAIGANSITLVGVADATTVTQADFILG
jgi:Ca2+-binding RTX toxin-like protein